MQFFKMKLLNRWYPKKKVISEITKHLNDSRPLIRYLMARFRFEQSVISGESMRFGLEEN